MITNTISFIFFCVCIFPNLTRKLQSQTITGIKNTAKKSKYHWGVWNSELWNTFKQFLSWLMCMCLPSHWGAMQEKLTLSWPCPSLAHTTRCFLVLTQLLEMWTVSKRPAGGCGLTVVFYGGTSTLGKLQISWTSSSRKLVVLKHNYLGTFAAVHWKEWSCWQ